MSSHTDGVPIGYFPLITSFDTAGNYQAVTTIDGKPSTQAFSVFDRAPRKLVPVGAKMVPVETPTVADAAGVDPDLHPAGGTCPFHTQTLTQALAAGKPTALLISTPEFCQIGVCGPVLDLLDHRGRPAPDDAVRARRGVHERRGGQGPPGRPR